MATPITLEMLAKVLRDLPPKEDKAVLRNFYVPREPVYAPVGDGVSMTRQEFADECDINVLMARYERTGIWPLPPNDAVPKYLDVSEVPDYATALRFLRDAEEAFMKLPAKVRREFDNSAEQFVMFAEDPANIGQMREWGLAPPAPVPDAPIAAPAVPAPSSAPAAPGPSSGPSKPA